MTYYLPRMELGIKLMTTPPLVIINDKSINQKTIKKLASLYDDLMTYDLPRLELDIKLITTQPLLTINKAVGWQASSNRVNLGDIVNQVRSARLV